MIYASRFLRLENELMTGPDIMVLQRRLRELGHNPGPEDGIFGNKTQSAVRKFQAANHLFVDGIVDVNTWTSLAINPRISPHVMIGTKTYTPTRIAIDTIKRKLTFTSNTLNKVYPVAVGKPETPTPLGHWVITQKALNPGGAFGARWMRLSVPWGGYGIHGTNRPSSIGKAASHGCIRMYNEDVIEIYSLTPIGTPVDITGKVYTGQTLKLGCKGSDVQELQTMLQTRDYYKGKIDGVFGVITQKAVLRFQSDNNLLADGIAGPNTFNALHKAYDLVTNDNEP